ncbi:hypothetical protein [Terribacillus saccharophilus]|uniref:hypothetical protein n=1 Tax=Terribacillus saccharophilus TaxID=361277 RepID=UPI002DC74839|nr:hypothetical protein [Terribacillus saccharophilus]MEC0292030.1 hypothetical protein [Terribacillus saccharophilus]
MDETLLDKWKAKKKRKRKINAVVFAILFPLFFIGYLLGFFVNTDPLLIALLGLAFLFAVCMIIYWKRKGENIF